MPNTNKERAEEMAEQFEHAIENAVVIDANDAEFNEKFFKALNDPSKRRTKPEGNA